MGVSTIKNGRKWCGVCKTNKSLSKFYLHKKNPKIYSGYCIQCSKDNIAKYKIKLKASTKLEDKIAVALQQLYCCAQGSHKRRKLEFNLSLYFLKDLYHEQNGKCFYTGIKMALKPTNHLLYDPFSVSLDRINPLKGYTKDNIALCCYGINVLKGMHSQKMLYKVLQAFYKNAKRNNKFAKKIVKKTKEVLNEISH